MGDYIGLDDSPELRSLLEKRERVEFAHTVEKYDRRFKVSSNFFFFLFSYRDRRRRLPEIRILRGGVLVLCGRLYDSLVFFVLSFADSVL